MSARILTVAALLATVALQPAAAQGKADFSGSWKLNVEKSDPMGGGGGGGGGGGANMMATAVTVITQSATQLVIETKFGDQSRSATYNLDGKESVNPGMRGGETKSTVKWDGASLVIEGVNATGQASKEVRSLSADGKQMTVVTTRQGQNGEMTTKRVYDKQ
jgi:hypothetical protein